MSSEGKEKSSSKSSSTGSITGFAGGLAVIIDTAEALMVDTPSSSSSTTVVCMGGRILIMEEAEIEDTISDLVAEIALFDLSWESTPGLPRSNSSQSSSSLSDGAGIGAPSGRSKSASGHSSLGSGNTSVGAGMTVIVYG